MAKKHLFVIGVDSDRLASRLSANGFHSLFASPDSWEQRFKSPEAVIVTVGKADNDCSFIPPVTERCAQDRILLVLSVHSPEMKSRGQRLVTGIAGLRFTWAKTVKEIVTALTDNHVSTAEPIVAINCPERLNAALQEAGVCLTRTSTTMSNHWTAQVSLEMKAMIVRTSPGLLQRQELEALMEACDQINATLIVIPHSAPLAMNTIAHIIDPQPVGKKPHYLIGGNDYQIISQIRSIVG